MMPIVSKKPIGHSRPFPSRRKMAGMLMTTRNSLLSGQESFHLPHRRPQAAEHRARDDAVADVQRVGPATN